MEPGVIEGGQGDASARVQIRLDELEKETKDIKKDTTDLKALLQELENRVCELECARCARCCELKSLATTDHTICRLDGDLEIFLQNKEQNSFLKWVTAFMNTSGGGFIYIHAEQPQLLEEFDKKVDQRLWSLKTDNRQFSEHFERSFFKDEKHVMLRIKPRLPNAKISTLIFSMKTSLNSCVQDQSQGEVIQLLEKAISNDKSADLVLPKQCIKALTKDVEVHVDIDGVSAIMQESTRIQAKDIDRHKDPKAVRDVPEFKDIWDGSQKLRDYISAFASVPGGGSWFSGIAEEGMERTSAQKKNKINPKRFVAKGYIIDSKTQKTIKAKVQERTQTQMLWIGKKLQKNPVEVIFHSVTGGESADLHVMEVRVKPFHGLCFKYKAGPEAYHVTIKQGNSGAGCEAFELDDWLSKLCGERLPTQVPEYDNEPMEVDSPTS